VLLGLTTGLAAAELALRVLPMTPASDVRGLHELRPDRPWLYGMRPGAEMRGPGGVRYQVNADGFRDHTYTRPKPGGTFRIVVLGHSVAFGWGVALEDTYPKLLEARLATLAPGKRLEVLNLGVSGYNAYTEAALFRDVGVGYQPDLVMVEFGINDLNDPTLHFDAQTRRSSAPFRTRRTRIRAFAVRRPHLRRAGSACATGRGYARSSGLAPHRRWTPGCSAPRWCRTTILLQRSSRGSAPATMRSRASPPPSGHRSS
jgi:hypothetical protein